MKRVESNSTMKDFVHALAALMDEYKVEMSINPDYDICFESKEYDFQVSTTGYACKSFDNVVIALSIGNYEVE